MQIRHVTITVPNPAETARFLANIFEFPVTQGDDSFTLMTGESRLTLVEGRAEPGGYYHIAFDIPENAVFDARDLLATRLPILEGGADGIKVAPPSWDAHSIYFNAPGNLNLELIARHRLPNAIDRPFTLADILHISEVGVPVDDPLATVRELQDGTGLAPFGEPSEMFAPVGSDDGLLIIVKKGRIWYPTEDQSTTRRPLRIEIDGIDGQLDPSPSCTIVGASTAGVTR